jgi:hypothetical protein
MSRKMKVIAIATQKGTGFYGAFFWEAAGVFASGCV